MQKMTNEEEIISRLIFGDKYHVIQVNYFTGEQVIVFTHKLKKRAESFLATMRKGTSFSFEYRVETEHRGYPIDIPVDIEYQQYMENKN